MATTPDVGQLKVPVVADLTPFKRQAKAELKRAAEEAGREAGAAQADAMSREVADRIHKDGARRVREAAEKAGREAGTAQGEAMAEASAEAVRKGKKDIVRAAEEVGEEAGEAQGRAMTRGVTAALGGEMRREVAQELGATFSALSEAFRRWEREAQDALSLRLINASEFKRQGEAAAQEFNSAWNAAIQRAHRQIGLSPQEMRELEARMKSGGFASGEGWIDGLRRSIKLREADVKEAQARGLMTPEEAEEQGRAIAKEWNEAILGEIERRAQDGTLTDDLFIRLTNELRDTGEKGGKELGEGVKRTAQDELTDLQRWLRGGFAVAVVGTFAMLARQIARTFQDAARWIREVLEHGGTVSADRATFESVSTRRGQDPGRMVAEMRRSLRATVPDVELMRRATFALNAELPATAEQMGEIAELSRRLGVAAGVDAAEGFRRFVDGIARGRSAQLQGLGIMTRQTDALREWEKETGRSSESLSRQEKVLIHLAAVMEEARRKVEEMGDEADEAATPIQQLGTAWANLRDRMTEAAASSPTVLGFLESIGASAAEQSERFRLLAAHFGAWVELSAREAERGGSIAGRIFGSAPVRWLGRQALGAMGFGDMSDEWAALVEDNLIRTETSVQRLLEKQVENLEKMVALREAGVSAEDAEIQRLERQNKLIQDRVNALTPKPQSGGGDPTGPTPEQIEAASRAAKDLTASMAELQLAGELGLRDLAGASDDIRKALQELLSVQAEIEATEQRIADIRAAGQPVPEGADAYLDHLRKVRDAGREAADTLIQKWQRELPEVVVELQRSIVDSGVVPTITRLTQEVADAERELQIARLAQDPDRIARGEKRLADARKALREHVAEVVKGLEESGVKGESLTVVIERLVELLREAGVEIEAQDEGWSRHIRTLEGVARGVMSVANAMGVLNNETRQVLQGIIDIAGGIGQISSGNVIGGAAQAIGGVVGLFSGLFASGPDAQERARMIDEMVRLRQALAQLREAVLRDVTAQERSAMEMGASRLFSARDIVRGMRRAFRGESDLELLERLGFDQADTMELIRQLEAATGISLWNDRDSTIIWDNLEAALANLPEIGVWSDDLAGQLDALDWVFRMLGDDAGTAAERLERFLAVLRGFEGAEGFADEFARIMAEGGSDAAQAWLNELAEQFARDPSSLLGEGGIFYGLTPEEVLRILERSGDFLGGPGGIVAGGTPETRLGVSITEVQADRLLAIESSQLYHLAAIHALIAGGAMPDASMSQIAPPSASAMAGVLGRMQGGDVNVSGGINVAVNLPSITTVDRGALDQIGAAAGDGVRQGVERLRAAHRGRGAQGPVHVRVDAGGVR